MDLAGDAYFVNRMRKSLLIIVHALLFVGIIEFKIWALIYLMFSLRAANAVARLCVWAGL